MQLKSEDKNFIHKIWKTFGVSLHVFSVAVFLVGIVYLVWSTVIIIQSTSATTVVQTILNFLTLIVEVIGILYTVMLFKQMGTTCKYPPLQSRLSIPNLEEHPPVSIVIPIHEPIPMILTETLESIIKSNYPREKIQIMLADDTISSYHSFEEIKHLVEKYEIEHIYDPSNILFKAGMLNVALKHVKSDFVVFLDYDHIVTPNFLMKSIDVLLTNKEVAFVQSKVSFRNIQSKLQVWESVMYSQFFEVFARAKNRRSTVIFNGSTACFRKEILDKTGGIPTATFTEDVDLTIQILTEGYKSVLIDDYGSFGLVPATFSLLLSQILRWAKGSMHVFKKRWLKILRAKVPLIDKIDLYFNISLFFIASSMYIATFLYIIMYFAGSQVIRLPMQAFPPLIIMPIALAVSYQISAFIAVMFARKNNLKSMKLIDLLYFFIIALVLNPFTVYAVIVTLFRKRAPNREQDQWNEKIAYIPLSFIVTAFGVLSVVLAYFDYLASGTLWLALSLLGLSMAATFPVCLYFHFKTYKLKPYLAVKDIANP